MTLTATAPAFALHPGQREFVGSFARTTCVTAGQGGGKTSGAYWWLLGRMRLYPGESWLVGFPDYGLLQRVVINQPDPDRLTLPQFLAQMGEAPRVHVQERRISTNKGQIFFASGEDLTGWEGAHVKGCWIDEFDMCELAAYRRAMERTRMRQGWVLLTGTPRRVKWVGEELRPLWERGDPGVKRIQFPSTANPKYSPEALEEARRLLPAWEFKRLYLGELATLEGGGVFRREWWQYYRERPNFTRLIAVWDTAYKKGAENDYSVGCVWGESAQGYYLVDLFRQRVEFPELCRTVGTLYEKWRPERILVEDAASGQSLIQELRRTTKLPIVPVKVDRDKLARATAVSGLVEAGRAYLPQGAPWLHDFVEELAAFPEADHDDQVDVTSMALRELGQRATVRIWT